MRWSASALALCTQSRMRQAAAMGPARMGRGPTATRAIARRKFLRQAGGAPKKSTRQHDGFLVPAPGAHPPTSRPINELLRRWLPSSCRAARRWAIAELPHRARGAAVDRESPVPRQEPPPCGRGPPDARRARPDSTRTPPCSMAPLPDSRSGAGREARAASARARAFYKYPLSTLWIFETRPPDPPTPSCCRIFCPWSTLVHSQLWPGASNRGVWAANSAALNPQLSARVAEPRPSGSAASLEAIQASIAHK